MLTELRQINERLKALEKDQVKLLLQFEGIKTRASIFGAIGGAIIVIVLQFVANVLLGKV